MKILHITRRYVPGVIGGYERNCQRFSEEWVRRGHEVAVLTRKGEGPPSHHGVTVYRTLQEVSPPRRDRLLDRRSYHFRLAVANRRNRRATSHVLRRWRSDVVVFWGMNSWLVSPLLGVQQQRTPFVLDLGDYWLAEALRIYGTPDRAKALYRGLVLGGRLDVATIRHAWVHSRYMLQYYAGQGVHSSSLKRIVRGVEDRFLDLRRTTRSAAEPCRILCVGRLVPDKGAQQALRAFQALEPTGPPVELHLYGDGDSQYQAGLERYADEHGLLGRRVFIHGHVATERMPDIYAAASLLVFPAQWEEPSSNVLLEAMASALPIVATRTGSSAELLGEGTALLVDRGDQRAMTEAMATLVGDAALRERLGNAARSLIAAEHRIGAVFDQTEVALREVVEG
jgi:glycosyltransferase involved in cell wall biosynthesis